MKQVSPLLIIIYPLWDWPFLAAAAQEEDEEVQSAVSAAPANEKQEYVYR